MSNAFFKEPILNSPYTLSPQRRADVPYCTCLQGRVAKGVTWIGLTDESAGLIEAR